MCYCHKTEHLGNLFGWAQINQKATFNSNFLSVCLDSFILEHLVGYHPHFKAHMCFYLFPQIPCSHFKPFLFIKGKPSCHTEGIVDVPVWPKKIPVPTNATLTCFLGASIFINCAFFSNYISLMGYREWAAQ
ncbi:hypothetical protein XENTR_v10001800 [Xenopus tropicalis]|nr:hypothetical protein XENTR_v10001800 [Xenopus tropicalis]